MMKIKAPRIRLHRPRKRTVIIASIVVFIAALATYGFVSYTTWRNLDTESKQVSSSLKTAINESLGAEKPASSPVTAMQKLITDFEKKYSSAPCTVWPVIGWQTAIAQVKSLTQECEQRFAHALELIASLKPLIQFIQHEKKANDLVTTAIESTKAPTDYAAASAAWKSVVDSGDLNNTGSFQVVADKIKTVAEPLSAAYAALATASKNEDKAGLDAAIKALDTAYASIKDIGPLAVSTRSTLVETIADNYDKL